MVSRLNSDGISPVRWLPSPNHSSFRWVRFPSADGISPLSPLPPRCSSVTRPLTVVTPCQVFRGLLLSQLVLFFQVGPSVAL